jgi:hypothetical protein
VEVEADPANNKLIRRRKMGGSKVGDDGLVITADDGAGYQFLQTRGLFIIDTSKSTTDGNIGLMAGM